MIEYKGGKSVDDRGSLTYFNDFDLQGLNIKRFYVVQNHDIHTVRAWHGHKFENKWVTCLRGAAIIGTASIEGLFTTPITTFVNTKKIYISADSPKMIYLPAGSVNGSRMLESGTVLMYFSDKSVDGSLEDDYRVDWDFIPGFWEVVNR